MTTQCNESRFQFQPLGNREVVARFDGGDITSDVGQRALPLHPTFDYIVHLQVSPNLCDARTRELEAFYRSACNDSQAVGVKAVQNRDHVLVQAAGEKSLLRVPANVLERQHGDHDSAFRRNERAPGEERASRQSRRALATL